MKVTRAVACSGVVCLLVALSDTPAWAQNNDDDDKDDVRKKDGCTWSGRFEPAGTKENLPNVSPAARGLFFAQEKGNDKSPAANVVKNLTTDDTRMVAGFSAATSSGLSQSFAFLLDFYLTAPFGQRVTQKCKPGFGVWVNARFVGQQQNVSPSVNQFVGGFEDTVVGGNVADVVQVADVILGGEFKLGEGFDFGKHYQIQPLIFGGVGFISLPPHTTPPPIFMMPKDAATRTAIGVPEDTTAEYVGFVLPDTHAFDRQWYVGLRLKSHHFRDCAAVTTTCSEDERENFPGIIDIGFGQNSSLTGGRLGKEAMVFHLDMFYPLPTENRTNSIYLFGSAAVHYIRPDSGDAVFLAPPNAVVPIPSDKLLLKQLTPEERTRDSWQVGVGVDLARVFRKAGAANDRASAGLPGTTAVFNSHLKVQRLTWKAGESLDLTSNLDVLIPLATGAVESKFNSNLMLTLAWKSFEEQVLQEGEWNLKAVANMEALLVHALTPKSNPVLQTAVALADVSKGSLERKEYGDSIVYRVTLKAGGQIAKTKINNRTLIVIPERDQKVKQTDDNAEVEVKAQQPGLFVNGKTIEITNAAQTDVKFVIVVLK
jgi:hypothetical protein